MISGEVITDINQAVSPVMGRILIVGMFDHCQEGHVFFIYVEPVGSLQKRFF